MGICPVRRVELEESRHDAEVFPFALSIVRQRIPVLAFEEAGDRLEAALPGPVHDPDDSEFRL